MKKIITTTFYDANNYGAVLQAYALQQVLLKKYDAKILDYHNPAITNDYKCFKKYHGSTKERIKQLALDIVFFYKNVARNKHFNHFRHSLLSTTQPVQHPNFATFTYLKADAYITGSDQVWNPVITNGLDPIYSLSFINGGAKKIAYAASTGKNSTLSNHQNKLLESLHTFDAISVREQSLSTLLSQKLKSPITVTLDPSLLLTQSEWKQVIDHSHKRLHDKKYILVYSVGNEPDLLYEVANSLAQQTGCEILHPKRCDFKHHFIKKSKSYYTYGPEDFVNLIANAEYVVTTSFHGTALAAIFNKKFFVVLAKYSDRITTLLNTIKLSERIVSNSQEVNRVLHQDIDWKKVNNLIKQHRGTSIQWLYNNIDK